MDYELLIDHLDLYLYFQEEGHIRLDEDKNHSFSCISINLVLPPAGFDQAGASIYIS